MTTTYLGLTKPTVGADSDVWGDLLDADLDLIDAYAGRTRSSRQIFTSGSSATYNRPANCRQLRVRIWGGGGGGSGWNGASNGGTGGTTSFGSTTAIGGSGGTSGSGSQGSGGGGGTGGSNTGATTPVRIAGQTGQGGFFNAGGVGQGPSASGGASFGCAGNNTANGHGYGSGGCGGTGFTASSAGAGVAAGGGGGGGGEYVEFLINAPSATYVYTVGAAGSASVSGSTNGVVGIAGAIIVEEIY